VACGIKARRPDLTVWVATGDGDCCSIGAGHWIHAIRYNMDMVVMLFDNNIYGLTKKQTSPTSQPGLKTNTHPHGAWLPPLNPTAATLGFTNASFVATITAIFTRNSVTRDHRSCRCNTDNGRQLLTSPRNSREGELLPFSREQRFIPIFNYL
ncbi:MAG: hypothetical protein GY869_06635, partial [Planctomycetes bacterium]|nr:hypothetical protein [Planctomycetota bacterium]